MSPATAIGASRNFNNTERSTWLRSGSLSNALFNENSFTSEQKLRRIVLDYSKGSKNFWPFVQIVKNAATSSMPHLIKDGQILTHSVEKANILAEMFSKNSSLSASDQPLLLRHGLHAQCLKSIFEQGKLRVLANLNIKKVF